MGGLPFAGVGGQRAADFKVAAAKGLQRVVKAALGHYIAARAAGLGGVFALPPGGQVVAQLRHQHRGGLGAVVAHAVPGPAEVELAAGREQGIEHELAVVIVAGAVAGAGLAGVLHQVKAVFAGAARVVAIVHAQQADHLKRNGPHGLQGAKGDTAGVKALFQRGRLQGGQPGGLHHFQRHGLLKAGVLAGLQPGLQAVLQPLQHGGIDAVLGAKAIGQELAQALGPHLGRRRGLGRLPPGLQAGQQSGQDAGQVGAEAFYLGQRGHALPVGAGGQAVVLDGGGPAGIAQQHALQAKPGAVGVATGGQIKLAAVLGVQPPAYARLRHPVAQLRGIGGLQPQAGGHGGHVQQAGQIAEMAALLRQAQQPLQGHDQGAVGLGGQIGNGKGDAARVVVCVQAKHGANGRGGRGNVRQHDDDVARLQRGLPGRGRRGQQGEQVVVQHFQFAHQAVGAVQDDGLVGRRDAVLRLGGLGVFGQRQQVANAALHLF